jgi:hypothetical protein
MIVAFSRKFIFVKTRKTAGTSIEIALSRFCDEGDIITPISPVDEAVRRQHGGRPPQNYCGDDAAERRFCAAIESGNLAEIKTAGRLARRTRNFCNHMPAPAIAHNISAAFWDDAFKFTIDRHPYEKAVSLAHYGFERFVRNNAGVSFDRYLDLVVKRGKYRNFDLYSENGLPVVDEVLKYEELPECFTLLKERIGIDISPILPKTKHLHRTDRRPARDVLSDLQKEMIQLICRQEFERSGYAR